MSRPRFCSLVAVAAAAAGLAASLAACSIPQSNFRASPDGGNGSGDISNVLAIVVSKPALDLDEGATADLAVSLTQPPASPLEIDLSSSSQKIGLSIQKVFFDANNFAQPQTVTITGLPDDDTATELAEIKLAGAGVADVMVGATVHDLDKVVIQSDVGGTGVTVGEGMSTDVHVHLSHRPSSDVSITAMLSTGPVTVSPPARVIHTTDNFSADVTFTLTAPIDQDFMNDLQTITFAIAGVDQKIFMVQDLDRDILAISASPTSIAHLKEGDSATLNLTLTKQPAAGSPVTVTVATTTGKAQIVGATQVTFSNTDYLTNHPVTIMAPQDANTTPETDTITLSVSNPAGVATVNVPVQIDDDDVQSILTTVTNSLAVTEGASTPFGVTLKFAPAGTFTVSLSTMDPLVATAATSSGANFLTFTAADYNDPSMHQVFVHGTDDNDLVGGSTLAKLVSGTLETDVAVDVTDDDHQAFVLSQTTPMTIPEGSTRTFTVALAFKPTAAVHAVIASTDSTALPVTPAFIDFSTTDWQTPVTVTVGTTMPDKNTTSETATISVTSAPIPAVTLMATVMDATQVNSYGWPAPPAFGNNFTMQQGQVIAYKVTVPTSSLDLFGVFVPTASADFRMALYTDAGGTPGTLVSGASFVRRALANGANITDISDVALTASSYWIVLRVSSATGLSAGDGSVGQTGLRCTRQLNIPNLDDAWPLNFGAADCINTNLFNFWITTYHQ